MPHDVDYWQRRERESLIAAERAEKPWIADVHRDFAMVYHRVAEDGEPVREEPENLPPLG